uniref:Chromosome X open reading frame 58 n=1 Tax=Pan paniscus TaxID=9597 RepID=A0A2R9C4J7_PANPA
MNRSSNVPRKGILKSGTRSLQKVHGVHFADARNARSLLSMLKDISAQIIQRAWLSHTNKMIFRLLKHAICAAEFYVTHEILKKVAPLEAKLIKDPTMQCKIRFRFRGETFPPFIVFKIFLHTDGHGYKYFSGKNVLMPSSKAVVDACKLMGERKFHRIIMEDERIFPKSKVTDIMDVVTMQDYVQYRSFFDEAPAFSGGRNNSWRKLNLENIPRTMLMYDIVHYSESGVISNRLRNEMKFLLQRPVTQEIHKHQLRIVSEIRGPYLTVQPLYRPYKQQNQVKFLGRRSKQAQMKVEKMRKVYLAKEKNTSEVTEPKTGPSGTKRATHEGPCVARTLGNLDLSLRVKGDQ